MESVIFISTNSKVKMHWLKINIDIKKGLPSWTYATEFRDTEKRFLQ